MEKAILKTLIYSNIFDYPLTLSEIHKWLIEKKATPRDIEKALKVLILKRKAKEKKGYIFLKKEGLVNRRIQRVRQSDLYIRKVRIISQFLRVIPWVKLIGISGGLAMENADKKEDIDLLIITSKKRLWLSRFFVLGFLQIIGQRRKVDHSLKEASGKICCNIFLEEDNLEQRRHDLYTAHEILQMKVLWEKDNIYSKFLEDNEWVFKFLPNWVGPDASLRGAQRRSNLRKEIAAPFGLAMTMEDLAKKIQMKIMQKSKGMERVEEGALYFHPNDLRDKILKEFNKRSSLIGKRASKTVSYK